MVSMRVGERAIPILWQVVATKGAIEFDVQEALLDTVSQMVPDDVRVLLAADRFYGTSALIKWCQIQGWNYRIRLKGNYIFQHGGGEITGNDAVNMKLDSLENATFNETDITTFLHITLQRNMYGNNERNRRA